MYCSKCGTKNSENAMFCKNCGASLFVQAQKQAEEDFIKNETVIEEPVNAWKEPEEENKITENPVIALIKKHASSSLFLIATILFTVSLGISLFSNMFSGFFTENGANLSFNTGFISISSVLALVGLWKIYGLKKKQGIDKSGLIMLKVACIIEFIASLLLLSCFIFGFLALGLICKFNLELYNASMAQAFDVFANAGLEISPEIQMIFSPETFALVAFTVSAVLAVFCVVVALYYTKALKTINRIKDMAQNGVIYKNITSGIIAFLFIFGASSASAFMFGDFAGASMGIAYILFAVALINFKNEAEKLKYVVESEQTEEINTET